MLRIFLNSFEISVKFCVVLTPMLKFCEEKGFFCHITNSTF
jgi:hypothetical protein